MDNLFETLDKNLVLFKIADYLVKANDDSMNPYRASDEKMADMIGDLLVKMVKLRSPQGIEQLADILMDAWKEHEAGIKEWAYIVCVSNWLIWAWHENGEEEIARAWDKAWRRLHEFSLDTLKGTQLKKYLELTD